MSDYPKPQNGAVTYSNGRNQSPYPPGTIANIQCNLGYSPAGTLTATCKDGLWSPSPSTECVRGTGEHHGWYFYQLGILSENAGEIYKIEKHAIKNNCRCPGKNQRKIASSTNS